MKNLTEKGKKQKEIYQKILINSKMKKKKKKKKIKLEKKLKNQLNQD